MPITGGRMIGSTTNRNDCERGADIDDAAARPQLLKPVQRDAVHRKRQAALRALKRQDEDRDRRPIEKQDEQREEGTEPIKRRRSSALHLRAPSGYPPSASA